ncbi:hypothetical protein EJ06DRAFT_126169 [Trichodelitschia bisporula]|uniref:Uncharacterized protein n=1 Tax=Trichodelitschia bisporula TaxID=703511 RepID=A0A6G1HR05_9PEZI|nr:hypothetical protein EJ06DRAFT_126169 [Trichodelitschia bisporula]
MPSRASEGMAWGVRAVCAVRIFGFILLSLYLMPFAFGGQLPFASFYFSSLTSFPFLVSGFSSIYAKKSGLLNLFFSSSTNTPSRIPTRSDIDVLTRISHPAIHLGEATPLGVRMAAVRRAAPGPSEVQRAADGHPLGGHAWHWAVGLWRDGLERA